MRSFMKTNSTRRKLSARDVVKALFAFASLLVCSTKARFLALTETIPAGKSLPTPEIGGYAVIRHWSNELSDHENLAFLIKDKAEAYRTAKERFNYFSVREAASHNPGAAEDRPDLPHGNVGVTWATVHPITKKLFEMLEQNHPSLRLIKRDAIWLGVWTCKINGQDVACAPEEDPYERVDMEVQNKKSRISGLSEKARSFVSDRKAIMKRLLRQRTGKLEP